MCWVCLLHETDLWWKCFVLGQQHCLKPRGFKDIMLFKMLQALEINQASVSQLEPRHVIQGHKGGLGNIEHISCILYFFLFFFFLF